MGGGGHSCPCSPSQPEVTISSRLFFIFSSLTVSSFPLSRVPKLRSHAKQIKFECQIADIQPSGHWCLLLSLPPAALNSPKLEFYSCEFDWTNQCPVNQSKCIFKIVVGVFDVERKCHGGTPQLSYITGEVGGGHNMWFFSRLSTATQCQNLRIHIILLAGKYIFNLIPSRLFHSFWAEPIIRWGVGEGALKLQKSAK